MAASVSPPGSFLSCLDSADRDSLLALGRLRHWEPGDVLVRRGDEVDSAVVLLAGTVKVHVLGPRGADVVLGFSAAGDLLGERAAVGGTTRSATLTALDHVEALVIPVGTLRSYLRSHPGITLALLERALDRLHDADRRRIEFATSGTLARVAARLIELTAAFGVSRPDGAVEIALPINQEDLASWSAASRESTARALHTLRTLGLIATGRRRLTVLDRAGLEAHVERQET